MPKNLYVYRLMTNGELKISIYKVLDEDDIFYIVVNDHNVVDRVTKSHVDNKERYNGYCWNCIFSERNDEDARAFLKKVMKEDFDRIYQAKMLELHSWKKREEACLSHLDDNFTEYSFSEEKPYVGIDRYKAKKD